MSIHKRHTHWIVISLIGLGLISSCGSSVTVNTPVTSTPVTTIQPTLAPATSTPPSHVAMPSPASIPIPAQSEPIGLVISGAHIDTAVARLPMTPEQVEGLIFDPPQDPQGYWIDLFGKPGIESTKPTVIMGHGCEGIPECETTDWQFSRLSNPKLMHTGTEIVVTTEKGTVCYRATQVVTYGKDDADGQSRIFDNRPESDLVLVTCYTQDIHGKNLFVVATRHSCAS